MYIIKDITANNGREYIGQDKENVNLQESAKTFDSELEALQFIENTGFGNWFKIERVIGDER